MSCNLILNICIVHELNNSPRNPTVNLIKIRNTAKSKFTYNGRGIAFDGKGMWSFGNDFARNGKLLLLIIPDHLILIKKHFLILGEGSSKGINDSFGAAGKR